MPQKSPYEARAALTASSTSSNGFLTTIASSKIILVSSFDSVRTAERTAPSPQSTRSTRDPPEHKVTTLRLAVRAGRLRARCWERLAAAVTLASIAMWESTAGWNAEPARSVEFLVADINTTQLL